MSGLSGARLVQPIDKSDRLVDVPLHRVRFNTFWRVPVNVLFLTSPHPRLGECSGSHAVKRNGRAVEGMADLDEAQR
jgi:hypothetical protein